MLKRRLTSIENIIAMLSSISMNINTDRNSLNVLMGDDTLPVSVATSQLLLKNYADNAIQDVDLSQIQTNRDNIAVLRGGAYDRYSFLNTINGNIQSHGAYEGLKLNTIASDREVNKSTLDLINFNGVDCNTVPYVQIRVVKDGQDIVYVSKNGVSPVDWGEIYNINNNSLDKNILVSYSPGILSDMEPGTFSMSSVDGALPSAFINVPTDETEFTYLFRGDALQDPLVIPNDVSVTCKIKSLLDGVTVLEDTLNELATHVTTDDAADTALAESIVTSLELVQGLQTSLNTALDESKDVTTENFNTLRDTLNSTIASFRDTIRIKANDRFFKQNKYGMEVVEHLDDTVMTAIVDSNDVIRFTGLSTYNAYDLVKVTFDAETVLDGVEVVAEDTSDDSRFTIRMPENSTSYKINETYAFRFLVDGDRLRLGDFPEPVVHAVIEPTVAIKNTDDDNYLTDTVFKTDGSIIYELENDVGFPVGTFTINGYSITVTETTTSLFAYINGVGDFEIVERLPTMFKYKGIVGTYTTYDESPYVNWSTVEVDADLNEDGSIQVLSVDGDTTATIVTSGDVVYRFTFPDSSLLGNRDKTIHLIDRDESLLAGVHTEVDGAVCMRYNTAYNQFEYENFEEVPITGLAIDNKATARANLGLLSSAEVTDAIKGKEFRIVIEPCVIQDDGTFVVSDGTLSTDTARIKWIRIYDTTGFDTLDIITTDVSGVFKGHVTTEGDSNGLIATIRYVKLN